MCRSGEARQSVGKTLGSSRSSGESAGVCRVPGREQGGKAAWHSPYSTWGRRWEQPYLCPSSLSTEGKRTEERSDKLGAEPASSQGEWLEKDRVYIVPWSLRCPTVPDTLLTPSPSLRTASSSLGHDSHPRHSPNDMLCPAPFAAHTEDGASGAAARCCGCQAAVPGLTPASSPLKPKSSREKVGTEAKGTAQPRG